MRKRKNANSNFKNQLNIIFMVLYTQNHLKTKEGNHDFKNDGIFGGFLSGLTKLKAILSLSTEI